MIKNVAHSQSMRWWICEEQYNNVETLNHVLLNVEVEFERWPDFNPRGLGQTIDQKALLEFK